MAPLNFIVILYFTFQPGVSSNYFITQTEFEVTLGLIKNLEIRHCILIGCPANDPKIISDVKKFSLATISSVYINYSQAIDHIPTLALNTKSRFGTAILFSKKAFPYLQKIYNYVERTDNKRTIFHYYTWIVFTQNIELIMEQNFRIPYNCEFIVIETGQDFNYKLTEIYQVKNDNFVQNLGIWNRDLGLQILEESFFLRRANFNWSTLELVATDGFQCPLSYYGCMVLEVVTLLGFKMKFGFHRTYGPVNTTTVHNDTGDFWIERQPYNQLRAEKIGPIMNNKMTWYIKDQRTGLRPDYYFQPFETYIWLALLVSAMFSTAMSLIINRYISHKEDRNWIDDMFLGIESVCNQSGNDNVQSVSLRLTSIALRMTIIVLVSAYGAVITSFLAVEKPVIPFDDAKDFVQNGEYRLGTAEFSYEHWMLLMASDGYFPNELAKQIADSYTIVFDQETSQIFFDRFCSEKLAVTDLYFHMIPNRISCRLFKHPKPLLTVSYAMQLHDNSPFVEVFNVFFFRLYFESGVKKRLENIYDNNNNNLDRLELAWAIKREWVEHSFGTELSKMSEVYDSLKETENSDFHFVEFSQVAQVLLIPIIGCLLGILIITCEFAAKKDKEFQMGCLVPPLKSTA